MSVTRTAELLDCDGGLPVNCRIYKGQLLPALSPVKIGGGVPEGAVYACHSECVDRFFIATKTDVYASAGGTEFTRLAALKGGRTFSLEDICGGKLRALVISGGGCVIHTGESFTANDMGFSPSCGISHCGRLFGADGLTVYWSDGEGFKTGGSLILDPERGEILDICGFGEKLVFIRKYGLTTANMFGSPENFSVDITDTDTDEIYRGTAGVAGGRLLFFTASGLHAFDGSVIKEVNHRCAEQIEAPLQAVVFDNQYFLNCRCKGLGRNAVLCYRAFDGESYFIDVQADCLCRADGVYAFASSGAYRLEEGGEGRFFKGGINFGTGSKKTVNKVFFDCEECGFELSGGSIARSFTGRGTFRPRLRGRDFSVRVKTRVPVRKITMTAVECDEI